MITMGDTLVVICTQNNSIRVTYQWQFDSLNTTMDQGLTLPLIYGII